MVDEGSAHDVIDEVVGSKVVGFKGRGGEVSDTIAPGRSGWGSGF